ncbi:hypothetical protein IAT40_006656 [Kwoniella sp. CBS 6097]
MLVSPLFTFALLPTAYALPSFWPSVPLLKRQGSLDLHPFHLPKIANLADRAFVGFDNEGPNQEEERGEQPVSVVDVKDASTLTSLVMFNPSSTAGADDSSSSSGSSISLSTLSEGQSAAFNPTATTTLSLLNGDPTALGISSSGSGHSSNLAKSAPPAIQTSGIFTPYSNADVIATTSASGHGVVAAAASEGASTTSGADGLRPMARNSVSLMVGLSTLAVYALVMA